MDVFADIEDDNSGLSRGDRVKDTYGTEYTIVEIYRLMGTNDYWAKLDDINQGRYTSKPLNSLTKVSAENSSEFSTWNIGETDFSPWQAPTNFTDKPFSDYKDDPEDLSPGGLPEYHDNDGPKMPYVDEIDKEKIPQDSTKTANEHISDDGDDLSILQIPQGHEPNYYKDWEEASNLYKNRKHDGTFSRMDELQKKKTADNSILLPFDVSDLWDAYLQRGHDENDLNDWLDFAASTGMSDADLTVYMEKMRKTGHQFVGGNESKLDSEIDHHPSDNMQDNPDLVPSMDNVIDPTWTAEDVEKPKVSAKEPEIWCPECKEKIYKSKAFQLNNDRGSDEYTCPFCQYEWEVHPNEENDSSGGSLESEATRWNYTGGWGYNSSGISAIPGPEHVLDEEEEDDFEEELWDEDHEPISSWEPEMKDYRSDS